MKNKTVYLTIGILSVVIPLFIAVLMFLPQFISLGDRDFSFLPHLNATLNSCASICLLLGFFYIKNKNIQAHRLSMFSAFILSSLFLISYVIYHSQVESTSFGGFGVIRTIYFFILISHILLSVAIVPLVLFSFYYALTNDFTKHKKIVRWTYPIWLYVSISGVTVYFLIRPYYI